MDLCLDLCYFFFFFFFFWGGGGGGWEVGEVLF